MKKLFSMQFFVEIFIYSILLFFSGSNAFSQKEIFLRQIEFKLENISDIDYENEYFMTIKFNKGATYNFQVTNHIENFAAIICDGAKTSCALKVGEAASSGVKSALMALQGTVVRPVDGIIDESPETTMQNLGKLTQSGLKSMDPAILDIMHHKCL